MDFIYNQWQLVGGWIPFLSWWPLFDYFYDPYLEVSQLSTAVVSPIVVVTSAPADPITGKPEVPKTINLGGVPTELAFIGLGNLPAPFFRGDRPGKLSTEIGTNNADTAWWLNQSGLGGSKQHFCESTCGLLASDGTPKLGWAPYQALSAKLRVQKQ